MLDIGFNCLNRCKDCRAIFLSEGAGFLVCDEYLERRKAEENPYDDITGGSLKRFNKCASAIVDTLENETPSLTSEGFQNLNTTDSPTRQPRSLLSKGKR